MKPLLSVAAGGDAGGESSAREQQLLAVHAQLIEAWNNNDTELLYANSVENLERFGNGVLEAGNQAEYAGLMAAFHTAIPDFSITASDPFVRGDQAYIRWTAEGTNTGMFNENPPTGKSSVTHGFSIFTYNAEGKVIKEEAFFDNLGYLTAWGYTLTPPATP
jgi:predicted ester cyclase